ncbi:MAG: transglycosylase SLT domain-containing protein [Candidatus Magasanikbacteria bacterium]|nr:transglycosylase SLT domain-containing protein [Candidatus Magasanikbacteria bacterium]
MRKREALFVAAMAVLGGDSCRDDHDKEPVSVQVSAATGELGAEKQEHRKPRKFVDVLGKDLLWREKGRGITAEFDFKGEAAGLLSDARERMWKERLGSSQAGLERYFRKIIDNLEYRQKVWQAVNKYCRRYRVPPEVAAGVIGVESGGDNSAVSSAGARGIFQVKDVVLDDLKRMHFNKEKDWGTVDPTSVDGNCRVGIAYLRYLYVRYSQWGIALAAYRGGPASVDASIASSLKDRGEPQIEGGGFREFLFKNGINAVSACSERGLKLGNDAKWRYPFNATVMARPVYEILTSGEKKPKVEF